MEKKKRSPSKFLAIFIIICLVGMVATSFYEHTYVATVTDTNHYIRHSKKANRTTYVVYCEEDNGVQHEFKDATCYLRGKFSSAKYFNDLKVGQTYKFKVVGFSLPIIGWRENIIAVEEVP